MSTVKALATTQINDKYDADKDDFKNADDPTPILSMASNLQGIFFTAYILYIF